MMWQKPNVKIKKNTMKHHVWKGTQMSWKITKPQAHLLNQKKACQVSNKALIKAWIKVWVFLLFFDTAARLTHPYSESGIHTVEIRMRMYSLTERKGAWEFLTYVKPTAGNPLKTKKLETFECNRSTDWSGNGKENGKDLRSRAQMAIASSRNSEP